MPRQPLHKTLAKSGAVAYLAAYAEQLTIKGVFKGRQAARTVFLHFCMHPAQDVPGAAREAIWRCPVDRQDGHHKPGVIAEATGLDVSNVRRAIDWLEHQALIRVDRKYGEKGERAAYGPVTILSTNWLTDLDRANEETRRKLKQAHSASNDNASPAKMRSASNKRTAPLIDDTPALGQPKRTVAGRRPTCTNGHDLHASDILKTAPPARMGAGNTRLSDAPDAPDTRPTMDVPEARASGEAGHAGIGDTIRETFPLSSHIDGVGMWPGYPLGEPPNTADAIDAEVERVMARLHESGLWADAVVA